VTATADIAAKVRHRIEATAHAQATRTWATPIVTPPAVIDEAVALATAWVELAERHGVELADLNGVWSADTILDAVAARDRRRAAA
jgi:hypothetical protein